MSSQTNIRHLKRAEIDIEKWNACIDASPNGLVYAYSWYLDAMCDHWDALVMEDYAAVMPIPWRKKWGIKYVYTPAFVQQLGMISKNGIAKPEEFLMPLQKIGRYGDYHLNFDNIFPDLPHRANYVLSLQPSYWVIQKGYDKHLRRNLVRATRNGLTYHSTKDFQQAILVFQTLFVKQLPGTRSEDYDKLARFCATQQHWCIRTVADSAGNTVATALMLCVNNRYYLLLPAVTVAGRDLSAGHYLIDQFIQEHAGQKRVLDFEGSDLSGVQRFYASFGGINQPYFFYHWNHLPIPLRWLKK